MSVIKSEDSKKWINSFVAVCSILVGYLVIKFLGQMGEWFDLEAKVKNFLMVSQGVGILFGLGTFIFVTKNVKAAGHMDEVYAELVKVVWPEKDNVVKSTIGIVIGVSIISGLFVAVDFLFRKLLELAY
ncbi:MAG: preprotein translocase subunit SecE [Oligoflexia bacterium]|nr:preprotein translocase subunit SecE [Oligoflexia bacterium]